MAEQSKKMSVEEILAAARKADGKRGQPEQEGGPEQSAPDESAPQTKADGASGKASPAGKQDVSKSATPGERPSVADILAMARGSKAAPAAAAKPRPKASPKPAASASKPSAPKPAQKEKPAAPAPKDTASILLAARKSTRPGPISKAEAQSRSAAKPSPASRPRREVPPPPAKPSYARAPAAKPVSQAEVGRRSAMLSVLVGSTMAIGFSSLAATLFLWTLGLARFMFPNVLREPPSQFKVGFPTDFAPGTVETKFKAQFGVWVVNYAYKGEPQLYALKSVCTHLGCTPNWLESEQKFKCPCHGSGFYKTGINFEGPAPRPLERYAIRIADDGQVQIDKSRTFQEEMGQWEDPASYVAV